jgi:probable HAF family extracellular repeat protein
MRFRSVGFSSVAMVLAAVSVAGAIQYPVTDIGSLQGRATTPLSINAAGTIVGSSDIVLFGYDLPHAMMWSSGSMTDLGCLPDCSPFFVTVARSVNDAGQIVGVNIDLVGDGLHNHGFLWQDGDMTDLGTLSGDAADTSTAFGINNVGQIVGNSATQAEPNVQHGFVWIDGTIIGLDPLPGNTACFAWDINDSGVIVGQSGTHACMWTDLVPSDLGTLASFTTGSQAIAVNESAQAIGMCNDANGVVHSFLWNGKKMTDLGTLPGFRSTLAAALNDGGMVVGSISEPNVANHAFLWKAGTLYDLNTVINPASGWVLEVAFAVNNAGQIAGTGKLNGVAKAFTMKVYTLNLNIMTPDKGTVTVVPDQAFYEPNTTVSLTATAAEKKSFVGWSGDVPVGHETDNPLSLKLNSSKNVTATFKCGSGLGPMLPLAFGLMGLAFVWRRR